MTSLTGTGVLVRFALRRDRVRVLAWVGAIAVLVMVTASSVKGLYPTTESLRQAAAVIEDNPAALAFGGPAQGLDTVGGRVAFETGSFALVLMGLMSAFMVTRLTRTEEETGRLELVRSTRVGRHAPLAAALVVVFAMCLVTGALSALALVGQDLDVAGSVAFGLGLAAAGVAFASIAAVTAQVTENARVATGLAGAAIGLAFTLRAAGDIGDGALAWLSPIGWAQKARPFAGEAWWPLVVPLLFSAAMLAVAVLLAVHRDVGAGLVPPRAGPATAAPSLGRPIGLAYRLQRGGILWWALAVSVLGMVYGSVADDIEAFVDDNEAIADFLARSGAGSLTDAFLATTLLILALVAGSCAVQAALRMRSEETALRAEPLLVAGASRLRWTWSHVTVALVGSALVVAAGGVGLGLSYGVIGDDLAEVPRLAAAALVYVPAVWVLVGLAVALIGVAPRLVGLSWAALAGLFVLGFFRDALDIPHWLLQVSPFEHAPLAPAEQVVALPLAVTAAVAAALLAAGTAGVRQRDIG